MQCRRGTIPHRIRQCGDRPRYRRCRAPRDRCRSGLRRDARWHSVSIRSRGDVTELIHLGSHRIASASTRRTAGHRFRDGSHGIALSAPSLTTTGPSGQSASCTTSCPEPGCRRSTVDTTQRRELQPEFAAPRSLRHPTSLPNHRLSVEVRTAVITPAVRITTADCLAAPEDRFRSVGYA